jgi:hypothetical protein
MGQERDRGRPVTASISGIFVVTALGLLLSSAHAAAADSAAACKDLASQDPDPSDLVRMIDAAPGEGTRRQALVIGNDYPGTPKPDGTFERSKFEVPKLVNASRDAKAVARLLLTLQFKVACFLNVSAKSHDRILTAATRVGDEATNGVTLYYFAGHGFADGAESFLVGDGAEDDSMETLRLGSLRQSKVLSALRSRKAPVIAIFDMCRAPVILVDRDGNRKIGEQPLDGYKSISKEPGILAQYSTSPNDYAADLPGQNNGLYARVFLEQVPNQPGVSAEQLLNDKVGTVLAGGLMIDGKLYKQFPSMVASPDDWTKIQIFDASLGSDLDSVMSAVLSLEGMIESGIPAITIACRASVEIRDEWKAAAEPVGSHFTVNQLLDHIAILHQKMRTKGSPCPDILLTRAEASPIVVPPLAHVSRTPVILSSTGENENSFQKAKIGTWLATNAVPLSFNRTKTGSLAMTEQTAIELDSAFVPSSKVPKAIANADVYFTTINNKNAKLVDTKDQIVIKFKEGTAEIVDPEKIATIIKSLKSPSSPSRFALLILPQLKPATPNYLSRLRLTSVRIIAALKQIVKAGIRYDQIVMPSVDQTSPISLATIQPDEILVKFGGGLTPSFDTLSVEAMKPSRTVTGAKQKLELYEALTRDRDIKG